MPGERCCGLREEFRKRVSWDRAAIVISLGFVTIECFQHFFGFERFHALGYDFEPEVVSQVSDGPYNDCNVSIVFYIEIKGTVDFYACYGVLREISERRITGSEII